MARKGEANFRESVLEALATVTDPELDEPITDLGFVRDLSITEDGRISVEIVTSTFWCSPNFVYMMLEEARDAVSRLPGVKEARVYLGGHHDSDRINEAVNSGKSFSQCYESEASGDLVELNRMIRTRALRSRLYSMTVAMARCGITPEELFGLSRVDILAEGNTFVVESRGRALQIADPDDVRHLGRYLSFLDGIGRKDGPLVIWDLDGNPPGKEEFNSILTLSRSARANFSLNAELCRALLEARIGTTQLQPPESRSQRR